MDALIYCRVSTNKQEASLSSQEQICIAHAKSLGFTVGSVVKETFSGAQLWERPQLARIRRDIAAKKYQALIVYSLDRLSRDRAHLKIITSGIESAGAKLISVTESIDNLYLQREGYTAERERQKIRERCVRGKRQRALNGFLHKAGTDLYGYRRDNGVRIIYEPEGQIIRRIYQMVLEGVSIRRIVKLLNEEGIPSPATGKRTYGRRTYWGPGALRRILTEPAYKGEAWAWRFKSATRTGQTISRPEKEWIKLPNETTPRIVSSASWQLVQDRLNINKGKELPRRQDLLRDLLFCAVCGRRLIGQNEHGSYRIYRCSSRATPHGHCGGKRVPASDCERSVWESVMSTEDLIARCGKRIEEIEASSGQLRADLEAARREFKRLEEEQSSLAHTLCANLDENLASILEMHISENMRDKLRFKDLICEIESLISSEEDGTQEIIRTLIQFQAHGFSRDYTFEEKRRVLQFFNVRVIGSRRIWHTIVDFIKSSDSIED